MDSNLEAAHKHSFKNYDEILGSKECGCFYCKAVFLSSLISEWVDEKDGGQTALCPKCAIDSVIGDKSGYQLTQQFLSDMNKYWF